jgi:hypothetical protein
MLGALALGAALACSSSSTDSLDPDPSSSGGPGHADAGPVSESGPSQDAAPAPDGGGATDGGRDFSSDRTKFFGASRCAQAGVRFCEDFESGTLDTATWSVNGTTPTVEGAQRARGSKALHIKRAGDGASYIQETKTFPAKNDTYFGRAFVRFDALPAAPGMSYAHWTFLAASGGGAEIRVSGQLTNGANHFGVGTDDSAGTGDWTNSDDDPKNAARAVPIGEWMCIEWMHAGDTSETRFFWDAVEHPSLYTSKTKHGGLANVDYVLPQLSQVWIGWQEYQSSNEPFEMWVDEIAIDDARIGCVL